jgi:transcriptional regulator with XRE-family HTH domain
MKHEHGTLAASKTNRCGCDPCKAAASRYDARRYRLKAYGRWQPYVDAEPVRQHVKRLQGYGIGWMRIAALAGIPRGSVSRLLYGDNSRGTPPSRRVRPATAAAILAIEPNLDVLAGTAPVDATGTRRRIQALVAMGWSQSKIAARLGVQPTNLGKTMNGDKVHAATARAVRALYDELWDRQPPEVTHHDRVAASRARNHARTHDWVSPLAWDDDEIDDPQARPHGILRDQEVAA